jgi:hypothetical protein
MAEEKKYYKFTGVFDETEHGLTQVQYDTNPDRFMIRDGDPVALTPEQHDKLVQFVQLTEVPTEEAESVEPPVDQPGPFGPSTSTASEPVSGTTPDIDTMSLDEKKKLAGELDIKGRSQMSEADLTEALVEYYTNPGGDADDSQGAS